MKAHIAVLAALGLLAGGSAWAADEGAEWIRVVHRQFPISFEIPAQTSLQSGTVFTLASARADDRAEIEVDLFGIRPLPRQLAAIQLAFFWVTEEYLGASRDSLADLRVEIGQPGTVESFLRSVFYGPRGTRDVELRDVGLDFVDGLPARRVSLLRSIAVGTENERTVTGAALVAPVSGSSSLVIIARFHEESTREERDVVFPRVIHSLKIGGSPGRGALQSRALGDDERD